MADLEQFVNKELDNRGSRIALRLESALKIAAPSDTGRLRSSIKVFYENGILKIFAAEHVFHVEFGTKPHDIKPKNKKALKFQKGGKNIIVKAVKHPGTKPNPFIRKTLFTQLPIIIREELSR